MTPVYPKTDPEYQKRIMERFYKSIRETKWDDTCGERQSKPRGRKAKQIIRSESKPRTEGEKQASKQKYNWFN